MPRGLADLHPERGLLRVAFRLPIWLYRAHLGWLLGNRFVLLTHIGRTTRLTRQVVLEVLRHDRATDSYIIASAWGTKANWFQNIQKTPEVTINVGRQRLEATTERLPAELAKHEFQMYARRHPLIYRWGFMPIFGQRPTTDTEFRLLAESTPVVAVRPKR
jgi:deazaflavin-dependent oxidoreductase (nitroreductase family)